jgi:2-polyprenyl-3-methyl-5-hydroxy-6-metoxy-1,4-benzoquinol methylase
LRDFNRYQSDYVASYGFEAHMVRYRRRQVLACLARYPHRHILEVGCGLDSLVQYVSGWDSFVIVEPASVFATKARALSTVVAPFTVHEMTLEQAAPRLRGQRFDFVILSSVAHEVSSPLEFLSAVRTLCSPDTIVHVNVPNARSLHNRLAVRMGVIPDVFARSPLARKMQRTSTFDSASWLQ